MADASALGADTLGVWVQVPSSVPYKGIRTPQRERNRIFGFFFFFFCDLKLNEKKCGKTVDGFDIIIYTERCSKHCSKRGCKWKLKNKLLTPQSI